MKNNKTVLKILLFVCLLNLIITVQPAQAGLWEDIMWEGGLEVIIQTVFGHTELATPHEIIAALIKTALSFLGILFVIIVMYGGFVWMTSGGNKEKVLKAKLLLINGTIGAIVIISAYSITVFVIQNIIKATN